MQQRLSRLVAGVAISVFVPVPMVVTVAAPAAAIDACEPTHPPARTYGLHALDVVVNSLSAGHFTEQRFRLFADNPCNGTGCPQDAPCTPTFTYLTVSGRRTAGSGALCGFKRVSENTYALDPASDRLSYAGSWYWTDNDSRANGGFYGPALNNNCAGSYDVVATIRNENYDGSLISGSNTFRQSRSFVVRRPSRLTTNVTATTTRIGSSVSVRGRLTRTDWDKPTNPQAAYAGKEVWLQRAASTRGIYHTLKSVVTGKHGYARTEVKALSGTRCYRWVFPANSTTQRKVSELDCLVAN